MIIVPTFPIVFCFLLNLFFVVVFFVCFFDVCFVVFCLAFDISSLFCLYYCVVSLLVLVLIFVYFRGVRLKEYLLSLLLR